MLNILLKRFLFGVFSVVLICQAPVPAFGTESDALAPNTSLRGTSAAGLLSNYLDVLSARALRIAQDMAAGRKEDATVENFAERLAPKSLDPATNRLNIKADFGGKTFIITVEMDYVSFGIVPSAHGPKLEYLVFPVLVNGRDPILYLYCDRDDMQIPRDVLDKVPRIFTEVEKMVWMDRKEQIEQRIFVPRSRPKVALKKPARPKRSSSRSQCLIRTFTAALALTMTGCNAQLPPGTALSAPTASAHTNLIDNAGNLPTGFVSPAMTIEHAPPGQTGPTMISVHASGMTLPPIAVYLPNGGDLNKMATVRKTAASANGQIVAVQAMSSYPYVVVYKNDTHQENLASVIAVFDLLGEDISITAMTMSPSGSHVVLSDNKGALWVLDVNTHVIHKILPEGLDFPVNYIGIAPSGDVVYLRGFSGDGRLMGRWIAVGDGIRNLIGKEPEIPEVEPTKIFRLGTNFHHRELDVRVFSLGPIMQVEATLRDGKDVRKTVYNLAPGTDTPGIKLSEDKKDLRISIDGTEWNLSLDTALNIPERASSAGMFRAQVAYMRQNPDGTYTMELSPPTLSRYPTYDVVLIGRVPDGVPFDFTQSLHQWDFVRRFVVEPAMRYFTSGVGIDALTGLPYDHIRVNRVTGEIVDVGRYWAASKEAFDIPRLLGGIAGTWVGKHGFETVPNSTALQQELKLKLTVLKAYSIAKPERFGLFSWSNFVGTGLTPASNEVPTLDNGLLSWALAGVVGVLEGQTDSESISIVQLAKDILARQNYSKFYDPATGRLSGVGKIVGTTMSLSTDYQLNDMFEGSLAVLWGVLTGQVPETAWDNLRIPVVSYPTQDGQTIVTLQGWRGSFHEHLLLAYIRMMQTQLAPAYYNYNVAQADTANRLGSDGLSGTAYGTVKKQRP